MSNDNANSSSSAPKIPRQTNDYTSEAVAERQQFVYDQTQVSLKHVTHGSLPLDSLAGNIENYIGVAQVPIGLAGPLRINGQHAQGDFYIPMATTEGTLVASYSRGMRVLSELGGVTTTVIERYMQRAPVFHFDDAQQACDFGDWVAQNMIAIRDAAEATTSVGKLSHIEQYGVSRMRFLRFNYTTGDAAGQNMCGKATLAACQWIQRHYPKPVRYTLSGAIDTDKKHSQINTLHSRGARVVAEAVLPKQLIHEVMRVDTRDMFAARQVSNVGALLAGSVNNGLHAANGLAALFIATGQDAANIAESHAGIVYVDLLENGDLYWSITLPSVIIATYGGGTGLGSQRECLEIMDCYGKGNALKFAEICAATVLAGELSLAAAVLAGDWVASHDRLGRNRP
ncbi:hydroxymethylglutaryl-CoA reductase [Arenicella chitinivorans]|uniref:hydroxymethylglutaryl-CoA reductase (NADPH) n=1 Tax=Arenicella chitinivorans TaxID=1329800 RepID=A0A918RF09_9GAMM|nr:hydroxymethylglutaryl-CoA reductase [Arenicella chitinivorans]GGZ96426.1 hydroxymethylglutaryl-CoA reductase [Arenicella chitinivorans]